MPKENDHFGFKCLIFVLALFAITALREINVNVLVVLHRIEQLEAHERAQTHFPNHEPSFGNDD